MADLIVSELDVFDAPVPADTKSYKAVPNAEVINTIEDFLQFSGYRFKDKFFKASKDMNLVFGNYTIEQKDVYQDKGVNMNLAFVNSYDKSRSFGVATGAQVWKCSNLDFAEFKQLRKHTTNFWEDFDGLIHNAIKNMEESYNQITKQYEILEEETLREDKIPELLGKLFYQEEIIGSSQLNMIRDNIKSAKKGESMWGAENYFDFYMHTTEALKHSHPRNFIQDHMEARQLILNEAKQ